MTKQGTSHAGVRPSVRRFEDLPFVTGAGAYVSDLAISEGTLACAFLRSDVASGQLRRIEGLEEARRMPGVVEIVTAAEVSLPDIPGDFYFGAPVHGMDRPPLVNSRVRFHGEAIAAVVAGDPHLAVDARDSLWPDIEVMKSVSDPEESLKGDLLVHERAGTNVVETFEFQNGDLTPGEIRVEVTADNQRLVPSPIETLGIVVEPDPDGRLHVWCGHQAPHRLRSQLASLLDMRAEEIHVSVPDVGGAFGMKGMFFPEYLVVAQLARRLGRRIAWVASRREEMLAGTHGRGHRHRVAITGDRSGKFRTLELDIVSDAGAYPHNGSRVPRFVRYMAQGPYAFTGLRVQARTVVTNRTPTGSYRGAGRPEAAYALERGVEAFARAVDGDPAEIRRVNFIAPEDMPYTTHTGAIYDGGDYAGALSMALKAVGIDEIRAEQALRLSDGDHPIGVGISAFVERAGGAVDSGEFARTEIDERGSVVLRVGTASAGQGHQTVWRQIAASVFELPEDTIEVHQGDTDEVREGVGSFASRSLQVGGSALLRTSRAVLELARERAASMLEAAPEDVGYGRGVFRVLGAPGSELSLGEVAQQSHHQGDGLGVEEYYVPGAQTFPYGVYVAVVEVDVDTGDVSVLRIVTVDDCGRVVNPMIVEGQLAGSLVQGLGQVRLEGVVYDVDGALQTSAFTTYSIPTATDFPGAIHLRLETPAPSNPLGAKGSGEAGCIGAPPAVMNAVLDALQPYGVVDLSMPLSPGKVWEALRHAKDHVESAP